MRLVIHEKGGSWEYRLAYYRQKYWLGLEGGCVLHDDGGDFCVRHNDDEDSCMGALPSLVGESYSPPLLVNPIIQ